jgi:hypothetical protein
MDSEAAWARARSLVLPDQETWASLAHVHRPLLSALVRGLSPRDLMRVERAAAVGVALVTLLLLAGLLSAIGPGSAPSPFRLPVLLGGALLSAALATVAYRLWLRPGGDHARLQAGLRISFALTVGTGLLGVAGALFDTYAFLGSAATAPITVATAMAWLSSTTTLLATALGLALAGALGGHLLHNALAHALAERANEPWQPQHMETHS